MTQQTFWNWFYNSATILWSRLQVLLGCLVLVVTMTDMSPWLPKEWMPIWLIINAVITEYLRRVNTQTNTIQVEDKQNGIKSDVTYLKSPDPVPEGKKLVQFKSSTSSGPSKFTIIGMVWSGIGIAIMLFFTFILR